MTAYFESASVAHVMGRKPGGFESLCRARVQILWDDWHDRMAEFPVEHVWTIWGSSGEQPTRPWCLWCVAQVQRDVYEAIGSVLVPAAAQVVAS
jgi:hypothetical protein